MKKVLALMLTMVLVLSLAACGGGSSSNGESSSVESQEETEKEITADSLIGSWVSESDEYPLAMDLFKGGTGKLYDDKSKVGYPGKGLDSTWEIKDDCIVVTEPWADRFFSFEILDENTIKRADTGIEYKKK